MVGVIEGAAIGAGITLVTVVAGPMIIGVSAAGPAAGGMFASAQAAGLVTSGSVLASV